MLKLRAMAKIDARPAPTTEKPPLLVFEELGVVDDGAEDEDEDDGDVPLFPIKIAVSLNSILVSNRLFHPRFLHTFTEGTGNFASWHNCTSAIQSQNSKRSSSVLRF